MTDDNRPQNTNEHAPGTLSPDEVKDELRQMKNKLFNMPSTLAGAARAAMGKEPAPGQPTPQQSAQQPAPQQPQQSAQFAEAQTMMQVEANNNEVLQRLTGLEQRLSKLEQMLVEIHAHLLKS